MCMAHSLQHTIITIIIYNCIRFHFFLAIRCVAADAQSASRIANQAIDSVGAGARNGFTYGFTASNVQFSHQTWKVSQRNYSHTFNSSLPVSFYQKYPLEFKDYSFIDAKPAPD